MPERSPYSRVYWTVRDDDRLATIYPCDAHLAAWLRLLIAADMAWPAPADVPATVKRSSLNALRDAGVVELLPNGLFRFHGLDTERGRRRDAAQASAAHRSPTERTPNGNRPPTERLARRDETSNSRDRAEIQRGSTEALGAVGRANGRVDPVEGVLS